MSDTAAEHDARHRIAGYLLAQGLRDRATRERVLGVLLDAVRDLPETQRVVNAVERFEGWVDDLITRVAEPGQEPQVRAWLARELGGVLANHADPFGNPEAVAVDAQTALGDDELPMLPKTHPQDMPRQPLGDLPSVLRGEFWVSTARWVLPSRKQASGDAAVDPGPNEP